MPTVAIIGSRSVGRALAGRLREVGVSVRFGVRHLKAKSAELAKAFALPGMTVIKGFNHFGAEIQGFAPHDVGRRCGFRVAVQG